MLSRLCRAGRTRWFPLLLIQEACWIELKEKRGQRTETFAHALLDIGHNIFQQTKQVIVRDMGVLLLLQWPGERKEVGRRGTHSCFGITYEFSEGYLTFDAVPIACGRQQLESPHADDHAEMRVTYVALLQCLNEFLGMNDTGSCRPSTEMSISSYVGKICIG